MELKERLAEVRMEHGLTQEDLAEKIGVTRQSVSKWERGVISPSAVNLIALGRLYGIPLDVLVNGEPPAGEHTEEVEKPEGNPPRKRAGTLKMVGATVAAAALVLLVTAASVITIASAIKKEPEYTEDGFPIIDQNDLRVEDIDLSQVIDLSDETEIIHLPDGTTTIFFDVTLEP